MFIGVELQGNALEKSQTLAAAGDRCAVFENLRDVQSIKAKLSKISLLIRGAGGQSTDVSSGEHTVQVDSDFDNDYRPGIIQKKSRAHVVATSHGAGRVCLGDVGIVKRRDADGDYIVNFPVLEEGAAALRTLNSTQWLT